MFGEDPGPGGPRGHPYELNALKARVALPTDPADGIAEVRVRRLRLSLLGQQKGRIILEADPEGHPEQVYDLLERVFDEHRWPRALYNVTQASLQFRFVPTGEERPRRMSFDVSYPNSCNLRSLRDDDRELGEKYLKRWGIDRA